MNKSKVIQDIQDRRQGRRAPLLSFFLCIAPPAPAPPAPAPLAPVKRTGDRARDRTGKRKTKPALGNRSG